ncbi:MAG TPA: TIGR03067 domain-containing protein [Urbifossiella sp.]|jgi:uncharacterized protein (TIGR03067 family)|nr:TIGR03067 domain-containing protein [Urbifossiella sp.]
MRIAPLLTAATLAAGLVGFSTLSGQPPTIAKKADPDLAALQGNWVVTKLEMPRPGESVPAEVLKLFEVTVRGDLLTVRPPAEGNRPEPPVTFRLVLDSGKTPRQADASAIDDKGEPRRRIAYSTAKGGVAIDRGPAPPVRAIYKLEADTLTVCAPLGEQGDRPTAFKAAAPRDPKSFRADDQGHTVIQLAKKK